MNDAATAISLSMLRLLSSKAQDLKNFFYKSSKSCHVGIHWKALSECSQMSTHLPGFRSFFRFWHHFVMAKLATSSTRVKHCMAKLPMLRTTSILHSD